MFQMKQRISASGLDITDVIVTDPKLRALYQLWIQKRGARPAPARADFAIEDFRPWLGHLIILDCLPNDDFRYRLYGTDLVSLFGFDLTGMTAQEAVVLIGDKPLEEYRQVCRLGLPVSISRSSPSARKHLCVDKLALPLMEEGTITKILAAIYPTADI